MPNQVSRWPGPGVPHDREVAQSPSESDHTRTTPGAASPSGISPVVRTSVALKYSRVVLLQFVDLRTQCLNLREDVLEGDLRALLSRGKQGDLVKEP